MSTATDFPILSLLLFILGFFSIAFGLTAFVVWAIFKEDDILKIYFSARRMHLRDKGVVEIERIDDTKGYVLKHAVCNTRVRVGIPKDGGSVYYCWRCEHVIESFSSGGKGPSGGNDNPVTPPEDTAPIPKDIVEASEKVIQSLKKGSSLK